MVYVHLSKHFAMRSLLIGRPNIALFFQFRVIRPLTLCGSAANSEKALISVGSPQLTLEIIKLVLCA